MQHSVTNNAFAKIAAVVAGLAMAASMVFVAVPTAHAQTTSQLQAQIASLLAQIQSLQTQLNTVQGGSTTTTTSSAGGACTFTMSLTLKSKGADVTCLQNYLTKGGYFTYSGGATGYFGPITQKAVAAWQAANGVAPAVGYFGPISRAKYAELTAGQTTTTTTTGGTTTTTTGGTTGGTTPTGNGLQVSLAPTSPNGTVLVAGQGIGDLGEFLFTNPTSAPITVTNLSFQRIGVSNDSTLVNVYLYNGATRITDSAGVSNSTFSYANAGGIFTVPAGGTYTVAVRSDIEKSISGQQIGVALTSVGSTGTLDSSVSFPINGGLQAISTANIASVDFNTNTIPSAATSISPQSDYPVWQNTVSVSTNPVKLSSMTFTNLGSADASAITNLRLYVDGTQVGSTVPQMSTNRTVTFDLSASPYLLSEQSHVIKVLADIGGAASSRTVQFSVQRSSDATFIDSELNQPVTPTINTQNFSSVSTGVISIQSTGSTGVSVTKDPTSASNNIPVGATSVSLATFGMLASGEPTYVRDLYVCSNTTASSTATYGGLKNGKIMVNGVQVGSTKDIVDCSNGSTDFTIGSSLTLPANQTTLVSVYADAKNTSSVNLPNASTVSVTLVAGTSNGQGQYSLTSANIPSSNITGNTLTVTTSSLTANMATGYANQAVTPGTNNFKIGQFVLQAGSTEGLNVNSIGITLTGNDGTPLQNLKLVNDATGQQLGTVVTSPGAPSNSPSNTFSTNLTIPVSSSVTIDVYADVPSNTANGKTITPQVGYAATNATGLTTGTTATIGSSNVPLQTITTGSGLLTVSLGASNPIATNIVAGTSGNEIADYTFSANTSSYTVSQLEFSMPAASSTAVSGIAVSYPGSNGVTSYVPLVTNGATSTARLTGLNFTIPANSSADIQVFAATPIITTGSATISGTKIALTLVGTDGTNVQVTDGAGNLVYSVNGGVNLKSNTSSYGFGVLRASAPTFAGQSYSSQNPPNGGTVLYQFSVAADPKGAIDLNKISFNVSTSSLTVKNFQLYDQSNASIPLNAAGANANASGLVSIVPDQIIQVGAGSTKTFILKAASPTNIGVTTGSRSLSVNLAPADTTLVANTAAASVSGNYVWSDRTANNDSPTAAQWTNGFLLRDLVSGTYSFNW